ncbi:MAG: hypothetical protein WA947_12845 [Phormidesmis sp.]
MRFLPWLSIRMRQSGFWGLLLGAAIALIVALLGPINLRQSNASQKHQVPILPETARSAYSFIDSIGVVTHLSRTDSAYGDYNATIRPRLQTLGIHHIRDGVKLKDTALQQKLADLATLGIKSTLVMDPRDQRNATEAVEITSLIPTAIEAVEGPNEWDIWPDLTYEDKSFPEGVRRFQSDLYGAIKNDPQLASLSVLGPALAFPKNAKKLGAIACDYGTMHSYAGGNQPTTDLKKKWIPAAELTCPDRPIVATEAGWHNDLADKNGQPGISEAAAGKYVPRLCLEYFNQGIRRVYINELIDKWKKSGKESHFGLLRREGSPKPAFTALQNLISLLQDNSQNNGDNFSPGQLKYAIRGDIQNVHHTLLQNRQGTFYLVLWQAVSSFNLPDQRDLSVPARPITLDFDTAIRESNLYALLPDLSSTNQSINPTSIPLNVSDMPVVVELIPA